MTLDDHNWIVPECLHYFFGFGHRRRVLRNDGHLADGIFFFVTHGREAVVGERKRQHHRRVDMDDRLGIRAVVNRQVHRCLARRAPALAHRLAVRFQPDQIFGREKTQWRVLPGDQKIILTDAATQVTAPATDEPSLKEQLAPANHFAFRLGHSLTLTNL